MPGRGLAVVLFRSIEKTKPRRFIRNQTARQLRATKPGKDGRRLKSVRASARLSAYGALSP